jgi:hypothetical protein
MQLHYAARGAVWVSIYLFFILAPLFTPLIGSFPETRDFWTEFAVAIGYSGLAMMGLQFGPHRTRPIRHQAMGRRRQLPLSPPDIADCNRPRHPPRDRPLRLATAADSSAQFLSDVVASPLGRSIDVLADRTGRHGPVAHEAENPLRDMAPVAYCTGGHCHHGGAFTQAGAAIWSIHGSGLCGSADDLWIGLLLYVRIVKPLVMCAGLIGSQNCARNAAIPGRW